jgi:uncharacterized protein (DUF1800 family)
VDRQDVSRIDRRSAVGALTLAGLGALLAACRVDPRSRSAPAATASPLIPDADPTLATDAGATSPTQPPDSAAAGASSGSSTGASMNRSATLPLSQRARYSHLLRRAGFGTTPSGLVEWLELSWTEAVNRLVDYDGISNQALEDRLTALNLDLTKAPNIQRWWIIRMAETTRPLEEKMTLFWHGVLTSGLNSAKPPAMLTQNRFLRQHALDDYGTILKGITRDEAMMRYLNTIENKKGHANENYARELMELFTLGPGNYTEQDVRESARAFTGLTVRAGGATVLVRADHDDGTKTFLGRTGNWGPDDIIDIILEQPAAPPFIAGRILRFFVSPNPSQASIDAVAKVLRDTGFSIREAMRTVFNLPEFSDPAAYRNLVKSPAEYLVTAIRQLGAETDGRFYAAAMTPMGQTLFQPPNVAGWPGGADWLNSGTWLSRLNVANTLIANRDAVRLDPADWFGGGLPTAPEAHVDRLAEILLDGNLADDQRRVLYDFARGDTATPGSREWFDGRGRALVYLMLALPEFHLN